MPQIAIEYSGNLGTGFNAHGLARRIHELTSETIDTPLQSCKTRLIELQDFVIGDGAPDQAMVHVDLRILSGRAESLKRKLGELVLSALAEAVAKPDHLKLQLTVEVGELDSDNYHKRYLA